MGRNTEEHVQLLRKRRQKKPRENKENEKLKKN